jgi:hypothetical protein
MRVLVVVASHGGARTVSELIAHLDERGHAVQLVDADPVLIRQSLQFRPDVVVVASGSALMDVRLEVRRAGRPCSGALVELIPYGGRPHDPAERVEIVPPDDWYLVANEVDGRAIVGRFGVPPERVIACGALEFDAWLSPAPSLDPSGLVSLLGLSGRRPFIVCRTTASKTGKQNRAVYKAQRKLVGDWLRSFAVCAAQPFDVLVMTPHPLQKAWRRLLIELALDGATCAADPADPLTTRDALFHSHGMFAVDPASLVEAVLVDRPAYVLRAGKPPLQTPIGDYLAGAEIVTGSPADVQRSTALLSSAERRRFLEKAVRPNGISTPAWLGVMTALEHISTVTARRAGPP